MATLPDEDMPTSSSVFVSVPAMAILPVAEILTSSSVFYNCPTIFTVPVEDRVVSSSVLDSVPLRATFPVAEIVASSRVMDSVPVLQQHYPGLQVLHKGNNYGVSMLTPAFLNPATREASCGKYAIIQLSPKP
jgi:hypothetical protein